MSRLRGPTLRLAEWKIATHLAATRRMQVERTHPAHGCNCHRCGVWRRAYAEVLPTQILDQLRRIGVRPDLPVEVYRYAGDAMGDHVRVVFGLVGRLVSGPAGWVHDETRGALRTYRTLRPDPLLTLAVQGHEDLHFQPPASFNRRDGHYLLADFQLAIPSAISARCADDDAAMPGSFHRSSVRRGGGAPPAGDVG
jgi:hypothetical protein